MEERIVGVGSLLCLSLEEVVFRDVFEGVSGPPYEHD
jgi:hypothetical protein